MSKTLSNIVKGDSIVLECTIDQDISSWKIRCEIEDECGLCIQLATANSGGSDNQINITDAGNGVFEIKVESDLTTNFSDKAKIEIEADTGQLVGTAEEIITIFQGLIIFSDEIVDWTTPSS